MIRFLLIFIGFPLFLLPAEIDTLSVFSMAMDKDIPVVVALPDNFQSATELFPVVYLLHGYSGDYLNWINHTDLGKMADQYGFVIVCPDGGYNSWYLDSPVDKESQYETFVAVELVQWIDSNYHTISGKQGRAITGLSMGGHGALYLALRHSENYIAAGSMSGVLDLSQAGTKYQILEKLGAKRDDWEMLASHSVIYLLDELEDSSLAILIDCGVNDRFINSNRQAHTLMLEKGIEHDYFERPGGHSWDYWVNVLEYHLLFFKKQLERG